jgi:RES domain-containing protein
MVYTSSSLALALLEILVHVKRNQLPDYVWVTAEVPDALIEILEETPSDPAEYGTAWLERRRGTVALAVPSVIIPAVNILLNPGHSDFVQIRWTEPIVLKLDPRLTEIAE